MRVSEDPNFDKINIANIPIGNRVIIDESGYYVYCSGYDGSIQMSAVVAGKNKRVFIDSPTDGFNDDEIIERIMNPAIAAIERDVYRHES